ncbi:hypothetical protein [Cronobacter phage EspYZU12]|nr:hypothetical protein EspYZU15_75 [Cronobacter phage EspYZU15]WAK45481.1 hypothetical protein EspYZU14_77 [Cronobacter phage EspYZU14]WBF78264.1 hypothetical protein [Cronobacter phage EspYZU12]
MLSEKSFSVKGYFNIFYFKFKALEHCEGIEPTTFVLQTKLLPLQQQCLVEAAGFEPA